ncbi:hypothetical protein [Lachnoclostridium phytofermentans]|uniref:Uncharacterized protein n=1 Tax=Lachnoclostridium phytofermentans (strain ATCC 700394 / DSM 18823 / ISDg) TaxID=357809 RepID=A9KM55_LACP7|nr:hypothetical protein [Lachnoclostridium phytofermentans]ABX41398.1 hypothetical protein Cphy_1018 [Lachnoclostridium phytofermentans ISDg]
MKKFWKVLLCALVSICTVLSMNGVYVSAEETFTVNDGKTTDFIEGWPGMGTMGAYVNEIGETVIGADMPMGFGHRLQNLYRVDLYTQEINYTMTVPDGALGFYALVQAEFINQGASLAFVINRTEAGTTTLLIGQSHEAADLTLVKGLELKDKAEHTLDIKFEKADGGVVLHITADGNSEDIMISDEVLAACLGTTDGSINSSLNQIIGGWNGIIGTVIHSYTDANRATYIESTKSEFEEYSTKINAAKASADRLNSDSNIADFVAVRKEAALVEIAIQHSSLRNYERTLLKNELKKVYESIGKHGTEDTDFQELIIIASYIEVFSEKATVSSLVSKEDTQAAENLKTTIDYDRFLEYEDNEKYAEYIANVKSKYADARNNLNTVKDKIVLNDIEAFETMVNDLSSDEKIQKAGDGKNIIILSNALLANQENYGERVAAASKTLSKAMKSYAGELAKSWDIYNVSFVKANEQGGIDFSATDYYNDDPASDVGISYRDKLKLDGLSVEFTYNSGNLGANVWLGLHFFNELDVMHISETDNYAASTGITTLIVPKSDSTDFQMGYPKLYGNCPMEGWPTVPVGTIGTKFKLEFKKNADVYEVYVTANDGESTLLHKMDAEVLETYLTNGEGYLNIGCCDKDLGQCSITLHTINGKPASSLVATNVYVDTEDVVEKGEETTPVPTSNPEENEVISEENVIKDKGNVLIPIVIVVVVLVVSCIVIFVLKKKQKKN